MFRTLIMVTAAFVVYAVVTTEPRETQANSTQVAEVTKTEETTKTKPATTTKPVVSQPTAHLTYNILQYGNSSKTYSLSKKVDCGLGMIQLKGVVENQLDIRFKRATPTFSNGVWKVKYLARDLPGYALNITCRS